MKINPFGLVDNLYYLIIKMFYVISLFGNQ